MKAKIAEIFEDEDHVGGDYYGVRVYIEGELKRTYGDYYHDKGREKANAFVEGYAMALGVEAEIESTHELDPNFI